MGERPGQHQPVQAGLQHRGHPGHLVYQRDPAPPGDCYELHPYRPDQWDHILLPGLCVRRCGQHVHRSDGECAAIRRATHGGDTNLEVECSTPVILTLSLAVPAWAGEFAGGYRSYTSLRPAPHEICMEPAIAQAAHDTLVALYPSQGASFDAVLDEDLSRIADGRAQANGIDLGHRAGAPRPLRQRSGAGWPPAICAVPRPPRTLSLSPPPRPPAPALDP